MNRLMARVRWWFRLVGRTNVTGRRSGPVLAWQIGCAIEDSREQWARDLAKEAGNG